MQLKCWREPGKVVSAADLAPPPPPSSRASSVADSNFIDDERTAQGCAASLSPTYHALQLSATICCGAPEQSLNMHLVSRFELIAAYDCRRSLSTGSFDSLGTAPPPFGQPRATAQKRYVDSGFGNKAAVPAAGAPNFLLPVKPPLAPTGKVNSCFCRRGTCSCQSLKLQQAHLSGLTTRIRVSICLCQVTQLQCRWRSRLLLHACPVIFELAVHL